VKTILLTVGKGRAPWADDACAAYGKRLRRFGGITDKQLKPVPFRGQVDAVRDTEAERILAVVKPRDLLVCLDERGEALDSHGFATLLDQAASERANHLIFALGGPYGHGKAVRDRAWRTVRLSNMVMNHEVARVVLYEQIYRGYTILNGIDYHH